MCARRASNAQNPVIPAGWQTGEIAVIGIGTTGVAVGKALASASLSVYASDLSTSDTVRSAAKDLEGMGVATECGTHDIERIGRATAVVVSPGVPPNTPPVRAALAAGKEVWSEIDLATLSLTDRNMVAVTGTNGKTTTTALIDHILRHSGIASVAAGNIGTPLIVAAQNPATDWFVIELSSFQLHYSQRVNPSIGVLTNLAPDHMDWYETAAEYYADKQRMFMHAKPSSYWVVNDDDDRVAKMVAGVNGTVERFSVQKKAEAWFDRSRDALVSMDKEIIDRDSFSLLGDHNVANALAATLVAKRVGLTTSQIGDGLRTMTALPHRLETVCIHNDVRWVNDSKATNVASATAALKAVTGDVVLILGGRGKGEDFGILADVLGSRARAVLAYGEAAPVIARQLRRVSVAQVDTLDDAVARAGQLALAGDTVLLSPACASFDQYENYMHRGKAFRTLARQL